MEIILEFILNLVGFILGTICGIITYNGFNKIGSPTLFRLTIAFFAIGIGFFVMVFRHMPYSQLQEVSVNETIQIIGSSFQTLGYFFIAFSHTIKSFFPTKRYFRSILPFFLISLSNIENIIRSIAFILLIYGSIETIFSYVEKKNKKTICVAAGLLLLALGEFFSWYQFLFPESIFDNISIILKIIGLISLFLPITKIKINFNSNTNR